MENLRYKAALEAIANFNGDADFRDVALCFIGIAKSALDPHKKESLLEYIQADKRKNNPTNQPCLN